MTALSDHRHRLLALALFALGFALVFRGWLFTGFDGAFGDEEDGYLALAIFEHWRHVFAGEVRWTDPMIFFPARGTLGYTDAFFLLGAVAAGLRRLGLDAFNAFMLVMAGLAAVGFFGLRRLAMRHFGVPPAAAAMGAFLFAFSNVDAVKLIHVQAYCAMLLPWLCDLMLSAWNGARRGPLLAAAAGGLYALLFLTAYQTSWFFACYLLLMALLYPVVFGRQATATLLREMIAERAVMLGAACGFAIGIVPFLILYVPVFLSGHSRDFAEVASNMPQWRDLLNVTPENGVWGAPFKWLGVAGRPYRPVWEVELAFTPAVLAVFAVALGMAAARLITRREHLSPPAGRGRRVLARRVRGPIHESEPVDRSPHPDPLPDRSRVYPTSAHEEGSKSATADFDHGAREQTYSEGGRAQEHGAVDCAAEFDRFMLLMGLAVVAFSLLQMDYFGVRPWRAVWGVVPGAKAIRYTFRSQLVANLFVSLIVARALATFAIRRAAVLVLCAILIIEQINLVWPPMMSRTRALAWIDAAPAPPSGCRAFYVIPHAGPPGRSGPQHQDDAMLFAQVRGIATVNGYSSFFPDGWALDEPASPGYPAAVRDWARRNGIEAEVCGLEPRTGQWVPGLPG
jgi:hypothetical protein